MPSTTKAGGKPARKPQTHRAKARPVDDPIDLVLSAAVETTPTPPAPPAQPEASGESLFDPTPPAPPAAEQPQVETAQLGEAPAADRPEGISGEQGETPATPAQGAASTEGEPGQGETQAEGGEPSLIEKIKARVAGVLGGSGGGDEQHEAAEGAANEATDQARDPIAQKAVEEHGQVDPNAAPYAATDPVVDKAKSDAEGAATKPSSGEPVTVRLGQATGLLHRMSLASVLDYADAFAEKIEAMQNAATVQSIKSRMRATEGRCAPIYFTMNDDGEPEHLLAGDDALAAAKAADIDKVFVVLIHPGDAGAVQAYLNDQAGKAEVSTEDDELVWRAHNEGS